MDEEAMEQGVQGTCSTQAVTEPVLGKAGLYGTMGGQNGGRQFPSSLSHPPFYQAGSRHSVQVSALACVVLGMSPRLAGLFTHIPLAVHGGCPALPLHCGACNLPGTA